MTTTPYRNVIYHTYAPISRVMLPYMLPIRQYKIGTNCVNDITHIAKTVTVVY